MKAFALLVLGAFSCAGADLASVHTVYLLPMTGGLEQFLAHRLTAAGVFQVVTDPAKADAVFTDKLGEQFEKRLAELYPPPPAPQPAVEEKAKEKSEEPVAGEIKDDLPEIRFGGGPRGKGAVFLVDRRNQSVLWSVYEQPKSTMSGDLDRAAGRIVNRLQRTLKGETK